MRKIHARRNYARKTTLGDYVNMTLCNREIHERFTSVLFDRVTCVHCLKQIEMREDAEAQEFILMQVRESK